MCLRLAWYSTRQMRKEQDENIVENVLWAFAVQ